MALGKFFYFNHFMAPKAIYTETLCTISSWAMDPPGPTLEPPMPRRLLSSNVMTYHDKNPNSTPK